MGRFGRQNGPNGDAKRAILEGKTCRFATRNGTFLYHSVAQALTTTGNNELRIAKYHYKKQGKQSC